jgi:hypothetical protein
MRVLRATGVESESALAFAGFHALLRPVLDLLPCLEEPQGRSLRAAFALADSDELDLLAVNAGALTLLAEAAAKRPLFVAVDDVHWLDRPADALAFAARRLRPKTIEYHLSSAYRKLDVHSRAELTRIVAERGS